MPARSLLTTLPPTWSRSQRGPHRRHTGRRGTHSRRQRAHPRVELHGKRMDRDSSQCFGQGQGCWDCHCGRGCNFLVCEQLPTLRVAGRKGGNEAKRDRGLLPTPWKSTGRKRRGRRKRRVKCLKFLICSCLNKVRHSKQIPTLMTPHFDCERRLMSGSPVWQEGYIPLRLGPKDRGFDGKGVAR